MATPIEVKVEGFSIIERIVREGGNSARVNVPVDWVGRRVMVILLDDPDEPAPEK
jgi:putative transposon-encoded protein